MDTQSTLAIDIFATLARLLANLGGLGQTEAVIVPAISAIVPVAIRRTQVPRIIVPSTAAQHTNNSVGEIPFIL